MDKVFRLITNKRSFLNMSYKTSFRNKLLIRNHKNLFSTYKKVTDEDTQNDTLLELKQKKINREYNMTVIISTFPFYLTTIYLCGSSILFSDVSYLVNTSRFAVKALILNQTLWSGVNLGLVANDLQIRNNFSVYDNMRIFVNYISPIISLVFGMILLVPNELTLLKLHVTFGMFIGSSCFQNWIDKRILFATGAPLSLVNTKKRLTYLNIVFIILLYLFFLLKMDVYNAKKSKLNIEELKNIYENSDQEFIRLVEANEHNINFEEISS